MMSLFKRETKEDKERKKLEKKLLKESKQAQTQNNVNLSNVILNKTNSLDSTVSTTANDMSDLNGSNSDVNNTSIANLITKFEFTPNKNEMNAPPRPKKGILKGMSKFHSSSASPTSSPVISQTASTSQVIIDATTIRSINLPKQQQQQQLKIDSSNLNLPEVKRTKDEQSVREMHLTANLDKINVFEKHSRFYIEGSDGVLLPGDELVQIAHVNCKDLTLAAVKQHIATHIHDNKPLQCKVKTSPESLEFIVRNTLDGLKIPDSCLNNGTLKRVGSLRHRQAPVIKPHHHANEHQLVTSTSSLSSLTSSASNSSNSMTSTDDFVWLVHTNGYSSAKIMSRTSSDSGSSETKYKIKLDNGNVIEVNEENIEKANPSKFDRIEDLSNLRFINETSIIHTIRQRYGSSLIHTYAGVNLVIVKPNNTLSNYNDKVISMFKGCKQDDMPPHVYSYTQSIYRSMLSSRVDHSMILMGHSGSGKTANAKHILDYLSKATPNSRELINESKINAMFCLLEAFCCIQTLRNDISNRFINVFLLEFGNTGQIVSLLLQLIVLDHTRITLQSENETNYLIFSYLLNGADPSLKSDLQLPNSGDDSSNNLFVKQTYKGTNATAVVHWQKILNAFKVLNFSDYEVMSIVSILAAIYHLGHAGAAKVTQNSHVTYNRGQFQQQSEAYKAANLLGITYEQLCESVFTLRSPANRYPGGRATSSHASPDQYAAYQHNLSPVECLYGFVIGLYQECLNLVTNCVNRSFKLHNQTSICSLLIVDPPGFQATTNANYADLISNYVAERLQLLFYQLNFINPIEVYTQEGLDIDLVEHIPESPSSLVNWLDKPPQMIRNPGMMTTSVSSLDTQASGLGLLWLLEEELLADSKSSNNFIRKLVESDRRQAHFSVNEEDAAMFTVYHQYGQYPVEYNANKWLHTCKDYPTMRNALISLQESKRDALVESFVNTQFNTYNDIGTGSSLKRQASVRKMLTMSKKKTFTINLKLQLDSLFDSLRRTRSNFVFCLLPNAKTASSTASSSPTASMLNSSSASSFNDSTSSLTLHSLDVPLLRGQLKAYQVLAACRIYRQGFPDSLVYDEFKRRYSMLTNVQTDMLADSKQACSHMIKSLDFEATQYKFGLSKLFFKSGIMDKLEDQREEKINDLIKRLQCHARRHLAQKNFERKRLEIAAIKCIQNNIRKYFILKKWVWWKLYTNLMPLVNVQNNETLVKQYKEDLDDVTRKYERLLNEKNDLKLINNQLETKLMNLQTEYVEEHAANAGTMDLLEVETSERMRLERELNEVRQLYNETAKKVEVAEGELLEYRLNASSSLQQRDDIDDGLNNAAAVNVANSESSYQIEKLKREYDYLKNQYKQDKESFFDQSEKLKTTYEGKIRELSQLNDNFDSQLAIYKRKYQKLQEEMQDLQRFNDEFKARNKELERTQSKYDSDMHDLKQELEKEINLREKFQRERDQLQYETYNLKADVENVKLDCDFQKEKCSRLEKDLREYENTVGVGVGSGDAGSLQQQVIKLKSQARDMEIKLRDQEEELDDQAATIQQLEQFKLKIEMQLEKEKQKLQREIAEKESEMDDLRFHTQKKIKSIEIQLEEEGEMNGNLQREKRDLERKLREYEANAHGRGGAGGGAMNANDFDYVSKLKRQLNKYKALASDAQTQLERLKDTNMPKQAAIMKALKIQLEDSEMNKMNALKAKQLMQNEIEELQSQVDDLVSAKQHVEEQNIRLQHEINDLKTQLDEQERECEDVLKKYQNHIQTSSLDSNRFIDLNNQIDLLTIENRILKDKLRELEEKINYYETTWIDKTCVNKFESKIRDLECKLDLELTYKTRVQNQLERVKQQYDKCLSDYELLSSKEKKTEDGYKRVNRHNKETQEEITELRKKLTDYDETKKRLEDENAIYEKELNSAKNELKVALSRIENFKNALNAMNDSSDMEFDSDLDLEDSDDNDGEDGNLLDEIKLHTRNYEDNEAENESEYNGVQNNTNFIYGSM